MPVFVPPTTDGNPVAVRGQPGYALWRHYGSWAEGKTVWKDQNGVWHDQLNPYQGGETHTVHDGNTTTVTGPSTNVLHLDNAVRVYYGGHVYDITAEEEAELIAAGYGAFIDAILPNDFSDGGDTDTPPTDFSDGSDTATPPTDFSSGGNA